jgi:hypothetical protein
MAEKGFMAKVPDVAESAACHRTTLGRFLSGTEWNDGIIKDYIYSSTFEDVRTESAKTGKPIFVSVDDTVNCKTKQSPQALRPMEGTGWRH